MSSRRVSDRSSLRPVNNVVDISGRKTTMRHLLDARPLVKRLLHESLVEVIVVRVNVEAADADVVGVLFYVSM